MTSCIMNVTTEFHYCSALSRNYGGKTREIIIQFLLPCVSIVVDWFRNLLLRVHVNQKEGTDLSTEILDHHYKENKLE